MRAGAADEMAGMSRHIRSPLVPALRFMAKFAIHCQLGEGRNGFSDRSPQECSEEGGVVHHFLRRATDRNFLRWMRRLVNEMLVEPGVDLILLKHPL